MFTDSSTPTMTNVTFNRNSAPDQGAGIYDSGSLTTIQDSIFWGDTGPEEIITDAFSNMSISDSLVRGRLSVRCNVFGQHSQQRPAPGTAREQWRLHEDARDRPRLPGNRHRERRYV